MAKKTSFLDIPPELRVKIYHYVFSAPTHPSFYSNLRQTCLAVRLEFDHEARKIIQKAYQHHEGFLAKFGIRISSPMSTILQTSTIEIQLPPQTFQDPNFQIPFWLVPWQWHWIENGVISINTEGMSPNMLQTVQTQLVDLVTQLLLDVCPMTAWELGSLPKTEVTTVQRVLVRYDNIPRDFRAAAPRTWRALIGQSLRNIELFSCIWKTQTLWDQTGTVPIGEIFRRRSRLSYVLGAIGLSVWQSFSLFYQLLKITLILTPVMLIMFWINLV
ncbi:pisatin demethylase [Pyrenophora seminiperda CCB06]|uniref:Pisatin demethylase n=1 Tax=Pyrenophora seminiperda CCB06 TaxID=1302712 RepID=A0A3M7LXF2_9PLEO|nr:pisatin demethylase [Pyrenophora seminiperda CCB06]